MASKEPYRAQKANGKRVVRDTFTCKECGNTYTCCRGYEADKCANCATGYKPVYVGLDAV